MRVPGYFSSLREVKAETQAAGHVMCPGKSIEKISTLFSLSMIRVPF